MDYLEVSRNLCYGFGTPQVMFASFWVFTGSPNIAIMMVGVGAIYLWVGGFIDHVRKDKGVEK